MKKKKKKETAKRELSAEQLSQVTGGAGGASGVITKKIDVPVEDPHDVVELTIGNVGLSKGDVIFPAGIEFQE